MAWFYDLIKRFCSDDVRPVESSVEAIKNAPAPTNVSQLRSWLGVLQYYHQFLPDLATVLNPLHTLYKRMLSSIGLVSVTRHSNSVNIR